MNPPDIEAAHRSSYRRQSTITMAIRQIRSASALGSDNIPADQQKHQHTHNRLTNLLQYNIENTKSSLLDDETLGDVE
ncbi:unnamed protein product [Schistosoma curassoni]|uniref:Uncharacterized protein n=1 Tax=Schistosoma curassoni TaxID=6186 RepID=A0A183JMY6_9TREM|nr:unnamed protein product [Schistosoma curassoni]